MKNLTELAPWQEERVKAIRQSPIKNEIINFLQDYLRRIDGRMQKTEVEIECSKNLQDIVDHLEAKQA